MAKVPFTKLGLKINQDIKTIKFNEQEIEIKQYLPSNDKLKLIESVINQTMDDNMYFCNAGKIKIILTIEIISAYTNINFTDKQKEDISKLYDLFVSNNLDIINAIPEMEIAWIEEVLYDTIYNLYKYQHSVMGIMNAISQDYSNLSLDATNIQSQIANPENLELLKSIMTKLG